MSILNIVCLKPWNGLPALALSDPVQSSFSNESIERKLLLDHSISNFTSFLKQDFVDLTTDNNQKASFWTSRFFVYRYYLIKDYIGKQYIFNSFLIVNV